MTFNFKKWEGGDRSSVMLQSEIITGRKAFLLLLLDLFNA